MKFEKNELNFIGSNKGMIKGILQKKYDDIIQDLLREHDAVRSEVLKLWAKECNDLIVALENIGKVVPKENKSHTGI